MRYVMNSLQVGSSTPVRFLSVGSLLIDYDEVLFLMDSPLRPSAPPPAHGLVFKRTAKKF